MSIVSYLGRLDAELDVVFEAAFVDGRGHRRNTRQRRLLGNTIQYKNIIRYIALNDTSLLSMVVCDHRYKF